MATRTCRICERTIPPGQYPTRGRCQMCASYWQRHGAERPPQPAGQLARPLGQPGSRGRPGPQTCLHCGRLAPRRVRGHCMACYQYRRRYGRERSLQPRPVRRPRPCAHCGRLTRTLVHGRCGTCDQYWRRHGAERPPALLVPRPARHCQTCGQVGPGHRRGRCLACYMYWYRHGRERPAHLWQR